VRASPHAYNSEEETLRLVDHVRLLIEDAGSASRPERTP
jgi:selenocysteine lyase/cysteine desulfurase